MNDRETLDSIREINVSYLILAQRMLREDRAEGMFRLGLSAELADVLSGLSLAQTLKLAAGDHLLCRFRFKDHGMLRALTAPEKHADLALTHTALLLAGAPAEQFC
ncbi:flagellar transcriptional activator FlhD [Trinickia symbiotica]|uniref:Flagellar transcriptional regulator FlhD n=1 Tax=Trinickia symbiotica TaxID=863227 RepID=A0A2N7X9X6_9BURK|nr:flagellar transcriptional regulator FlhD [Trinickia symbiotica]PMS38538.1 flagellar transcriptional regulator FlhD [Trinickia symbiotica]PPK46524.1 flagellar transcriptional activator FlhD [Trinickia symbiotica]